MKSRVAPNDGTNADARGVVIGMETRTSKSKNVLPTKLYEMSEFDAVAGSRSVADVLRDSLENAEAQLRLERRRARRAERRVNDLTRAVDNWRDLIDDYDRIARSTPDNRRN
jgi:hypothetical protein